jgi:hypothetical protein
MNEQAIQDAHKLFVDNGYSKSINEFKVLMESNTDAREDMYKLFVNQGYRKSKEDFAILMGVSLNTPVKKKEDTVSVSEDGSAELQPSYDSDGNFIGDISALKSEDDLIGTLPKNFFKMLPSTIDVEAKLTKQKLKKQEEKDRIEKERLGLLKDPEFIETVNAVTPNFISQEEETVVPELNKQFGKYGFIFEEAGWGDRVIARTTDGSKRQMVLLDNWTNREDESWAKTLRGFIESNAIVNYEDEAENAELISKSFRAQKIRPVAMVNQDGSESTVKFMSYEEDGSHYVVPTLFPIDPDNPTSTPGDWYELGMDDAIYLAKKRGEVFKFDNEEEAQEFAEGEWKHTSTVDLEAQEFFAKRGLDYKAVTKSFDRFKEVDDEIDFLEGSIHFDREDVRKFPQYFLNGKFMPGDWFKEKLKELKKERDNLEQVVVADYNIKEAREDFDVYLHKRQNLISQEAADINQAAKEELNQLNADMTKKLGVGVKEIMGYIPETPQQTALLKHYFSKLNTIQTAANYAALKYDQANTYFDKKQNKNIQGEYLDNLESFRNEVSNGLERGQAMEEILKVALGITDIDDPTERKNISEVIALHLSQQSKDVSRVNTRFHNQRTLTEGWRDFYHNPIEWTTGLAANSLSQMLPYGYKLIAAGAAVGGGTGLVVGGPVGAVSGIGYGVNTAMSAAGFVLEYTNAVIEAMDNLGYNYLDPLQVEKALMDKNVWAEANDRGVKRGLTISAVDFMAGRLAGNVFRAGALATRPQKIGLFVGERLLFDPAAEGVGEALAQKSVGDDLGYIDIFAEMGGAVGNQTTMAALNIWSNAANRNNAKIADDFANNINSILNSNVSNKRVSDWASNMRRLGKIDADVEQRIQENIGTVISTNDILNVGEAEFTDSKQLKAARYRIAQLLEARQGLSKSAVTKEIFAKNISEINNEIRTIVENKSIEAVEEPVNLYAIGQTPYGQFAETKKDKTSAYIWLGKQVTRKEFLKKLEGPLPKSKKIISVRNDDDVELILKTKADAIQEPSTEKVDVQKQAKDGKTMGERDPQKQTTPQEGVQDEAAIEEEELDDGMAVYTMNKTDKKIWSKDFEILDNRKEQVEPLKDDEGNVLSDKWIVVNKVTGETLNVSTKKDAQGVVANAPAEAEMWGDGQVVEAENIITPTEKKVPSKTLPKKITKLSAKIKKQINENTLPKETIDGLLVTIVEKLANGKEVSAILKKVRQDNKDRYKEIKKIYNQYQQEEISEQSVAELEALVKKENPQFQLDEGLPLSEKQKALNKEADRLMISVLGESYNEGMQEVEEIKKGSTVLKKAVKLFKGIGGKKDLAGQRVNAHKGVEGVFATVYEDVAAEYGREEGVAETILPSGTTVEVIEIERGKMNFAEFRQAEVDAINNSDAQVVKLITIDGKIKGEQGAIQEQMIIKDISLIEDIKPAFESDNKTVLNAVKKIEKAIAKILPDVDIKVYKNESDYLKVKNAGVGEGGMFDGKTIHINLDNAINTTVAHEAFHAILLNAVKNDDNLAKKISDDMVRVVQKRLPKNNKLRIAIEQHAALYKNSPNLQTEEQIAELIGLLSSEEFGYTKLDSDVKSVIKNYFINLAKKLGMPLPKGWGSDQEVVDLINTISGKLRTGEEITEQNVKLLDIEEEGKFLENPAETLRRKQIGNFDISFTEQDNINTYVKDGRIIEPEDVSSLKGFFTTITSPDDMLAGQIKYKGEVIFEGEGGVFFVTKFGDVWASGDLRTAMIIKNALNKQLKENNGRAFLTLTKGTDSKLVSSPAGVNSTLAVLNTMLDEKLIRPSLFRRAAIKSIKIERAKVIKKAKQDAKKKKETYIPVTDKEISLRNSAKDLKSDINKFFTDATTSTFETRGNIVKGMLAEIANNIDKNKQKEIAKFLGGDVNKKVGVGNTNLQQSFADLVSNIASEKLTKGLSVGDVYAVIEINSEVEVNEGSHPSYPFHISLKDGSNPILHLPKNREAGSKVLVQKAKDGKYNLDYAVRNISVVEGQYNNDAAAKAVKEGAERRDTKKKDAPQSRKQPTPRKQNFEGKNGPQNFERFKGKNKEYYEDDIQKVKTGEPVLLNAYHGTTNDFYEFDANVKGNVEGHLGKINYFTSDFQDANSNYQADGSDITSRVESMAEQIEDYIETEELSMQDIAEEYNVSLQEIKTLEKPLIAKLIAEKELIGTNEKVLDVYVKLNNPVVIGKGMNYVEVIPENLYEDSIQEAAQEIAEENEVTIEEAKEDYSYEVKYRAIEIEGVENPLIEALQEAINENTYDYGESLSALEILEDLAYEDEVNFNQLEKQVRKGVEYSQNEEAKLTSSQIVADMFKNLGYDGIILKDVSQRFRGMGLSPSTSHIHVFNEFSNQIKLADGTNVTFNEDTKDIRKQLQAKGKERQKSLTAKAIKPQGQYNNFISLLQRAFPSIEVVRSEPEFDKLVYDLGTKVLSSDSHQIYGAIYQGKLYLNPKIQNANTPIHEFGHIWINIAKTVNPKLYKKGLQLIESESTYVDMIRNGKEYKKIINQLKKDGRTKKEIENYILEEALATAIGDKGESFVTAAGKRNFKEWLSELYKFVKKLVGISKYTAEQLEDVTIDEFLTGIVVDLLSGEEVFADLQTQSLEENFQLMTGMPIEETNIHKIISIGRENNFPEKTIRELLKKRGFSASDINSAMEVRISLFEDGIVPSEFGDMRGGMEQGLAMFKRIQKDLKKFAKAKRVRRAVQETQEQKQERADRIRELKPLETQGMTTDEILARWNTTSRITEVVEIPPKTMGEIRAEAMRLLKQDESFMEQSEATQMELITALDKSIGTRANATVGREIAALKQRLKDRQKGAITLQVAKIQLRNIIRKALPKSNIYSAAQINRLVHKVAKSTDNTILADVEAVEKLVNTQRKKEKKRLVKKIAAIVKQNAQKKKTPSGRVRTKGITADAQVFFKEAQNILALINNENSTALADIVDELASKEGEVSNLITKKLAGEKLSRQEVRLVNLALAFDMFGGIGTMNLEQTQELYNNIVKLRREAILNYAKKRIARAKQVEAINKEAEDMISKSYKFVTDADGNPLNSDEINAKRVQIRKHLQDGKIITWVVEFLKHYKYSTVAEGVRELKNNLKHLGTLTNKLDKTGNFFRENIYDRLNIADEVNLTNYFRTQDTLDDIANTVKGVTKGMRQVREIIYKGKEMQVEVRAKKKGKRGPVTTITMNTDQLLRVYALNKNNVQKKKLINQGFTPEVMEKIESHLNKDIKLTEFADKVVDFLSNEYYNEINDVYVEANDVNLNYVENYFPTATLDTNKDIGGLLSGDFSGVFTAETAPLLYSRDDTTSDISLTPAFTNVLETYVKTAERYKAYAIPTKILDGIFSNPYVKALFNALSVDKVMRQAVNYAINPEAGKANRMGAKWVSWLQNRFTSFALALKLMQIPKQATSFINALADYSYRKGGKRTPGLDFVMFMFDGSVLAANLTAEMATIGLEKLTGNKFGLNNRPLTEAIGMSATLRNRVKQGVEGDLVGLESGQPTFRGSDTSQVWYHKLGRRGKKVAASPTVIGDIMGVMGYMINYRRNIKNGMPKAQALKEFNDYNATQQSRRAAEKVPLQMNPNVLTRGFLMFGSTLLLQMNEVMQGGTNLLRQTQEFVNDPKVSNLPKLKDIRKVYLNLAVANVMFTSMANIFKLTSDDPEDRRAAIARIKQAMFGLNLLYKIPLIGATAEMAINDLTGERKKVKGMVDVLESLYSHYANAVKYDDKDPILSAAQLLAEVGLGVQFDPITGLASTFTDGFDEKAMYEMLGVSYYYRPKKKSKTTTNEKGEYGFGKEGFGKEGFGKEGFGKEGFGEKGF